MASDSLKQVGKYLGKSGKDAERALKRVSPIHPRIERVRDVFDSSIAFEMNFSITDTSRRVLLDLFFNLPPPIRGCKSGCIFTKCEEYDFASGGNHSITVAHPYLSGSISVMVNGNRLEDSQVNEISPSSGEVFYQTVSSGPDIVVICYVYTECAADVVFPLCPALGPSFQGSMILFSDRFDKSPSLSTYGGLGYWDNTPPPLVPTGGSIRISPARTWIFENQHASGIVSEVLVALDLTDISNPSIGISLLGTSLSGELQSIDGVTLNSYYWTITMSRRYRYLYTYPPTIGWFSGYVNQSFPIPIANLHQKVYMRYFFDGDTYRTKIWPQNEVEPSTWLEFTALLPTASFWDHPERYSNIQWINSDFVGGSIFGDAHLEAIQHWGGQAFNVFGQWNYTGATTDSWVRYIGHTYPGFFWDPDVESDDIVETGTVQSMTEVFPEYDVTAGWSSFDPYGPVEPIGAHQKVVSWDYTRGKTTVMRIIGFVRWTRWRETLATPPLTIALQSFSYGNNGPPGTLGDAFIGETRQLIYAPFETWLPFSIEVPTADGKIQWGCKFVESSREIVDGFVGYAGSFFFTSTSTAWIEFKGVYTEAITAPIGGARPFCPDINSLSDRCAGLYDTFNTGLVSDYSCNGGSFSFQATSGQVWNVVKYNYSPSKIEMNNSFKFSFEANGVTADGSDGRCPYDFGQFSSGRSLTYSGGYLQNDSSPAVCGYFSLSLQFKIGSVGEPFVITSSAPGEEGAIGEQKFPYASLNIENILNNDRLRISFDSETGQSIIYGYDNSSIEGTLAANTLYNVYMELTDTYKVKIWRVGDTIPDTWLFDMARSVYGGSALRIYMEYDSYIDDNFTMEISNLVVSSMETIF